MVYSEQDINNVEEQSMSLISGNDVSLMPKYIKLVYAVKISDVLTEHPNTMLQFSLEQLIKSINTGWAVMALGQNLELVGFAQLWQYGFNGNGQQILELGSWLSFKSGCGRKLLREGICLGRKINPKAQIIAIVEEENSKALTILQKIGAEEIGTKFSPVIKTVEGEAAFMKIFDLGKVVV